MARRSLNGFLVPSFSEAVKGFRMKMRSRGDPMRARNIPEYVIAIVKRVRLLGYKYEVIASYFVINQGRIADIVKERIGATVRPSEHLTDDFPALS
jgi:hypothetical protein